MAVRLFSSTALLRHHRSLPNTEGGGGGGSHFHVASRRAFHPHRLNTTSGSWFLKCNNDCLTRKDLWKNKTQAVAEYLSSSSDPKRSSYHPSEEIKPSYVPESPGDSRLPPAQTARTIIEVNKKGTLMLSGLLGIGVDENVFWPNIPYVTDQHGNIYFQVKEKEDIMQTVLTSDNNYVQVIVGFDTMEMIKDMELSCPSGIGFEIEEIEDGISEVKDEGEDKDDEEWVAVLEDDEDDDDDYISDSDESLGDWANLETMRNCHPTYFARRVAEVASNDPVNWMEQASAGLAIQGLLSHVVVKDHSDITSETLQLEDSRNAISYYKLEMIRIKLITAQGHQSEVEVEDVRKVRPDAIACGSGGIVSRLEENGNKLTEALRSLCWRHNKIQAEEVKLLGVDSLGFDLRVCSGMQIETLRFAFLIRATSVQSAEEQLRELLLLFDDSTPLKPNQTSQMES